MNELITFPDIVELVADYLRPRLGVPVGARVPVPLPDLFVTLSRDGGIRRNMVVDAPMITVNVWCSSPERAHDMAQEARGLLHATVNTYLADSFVYRVDEAAGPYENPDPVTDMPRYTFAAQVALRGKVEQLA